MRIEFKFYHKFSYLFLHVLVLSFLEINSSVITLVHIILKLKCVPSSAINLLKMIRFVYSHMLVVFDIDFCTHMRLISGITMSTNVSRMEFRIQLEIRKYMEINKYNFQM